MSERSQKFSYASNESKYETIEQFLRAQFDRTFTMKELEEETGIKRDVALTYLRERPDVEASLVRKDGYVERWKSNVVPLPPTEAGMWEERISQLQHLDQMGKQAREDYYWTLTRGQRKIKVIKRI